MPADSSRGTILAAAIGAPAPSSAAMVDACVAPRSRAAPPLRPGVLCVAMHRTVASAAMAAAITWRWSSSGSTSPDSHS